MSVFVIFLKTVNGYSDTQNRDIPLAVFENFRALELDNSGIRYNILGKDVKYFSDKKEFNYIILSKDNQTIYAKSGFFKNDTLILDKDIRYTKDNNTFRLNGAYIEYDTSNKKVVAKDIKAVFKE